MALTKQDVRELYQRRSRRYDLTANLYYGIGFREYAYRRRAVSSLKLLPGDTVVEIGCGTGLNFEYLEAAIGSSGRLIGVDMTSGMLSKALDRVCRNGWRNVELVEGDAAQFDFPPAIQGVISTFALTLMPEYETILASAARALAPGARLVVADFKQPAGWPDWLVDLGVRLTAPFGVSLDLTERHPWEVMERYLSNVSVQESYLGAVYIATGVSG